jgi:hypothetical protein
LTSDIHIPCSQIGATPEVAKYSASLAARVKVRRIGGFGKLTAIGVVGAWLGIPAGPFGV